MNNQQQQWEESYQNRDNFLFYPHEEVIRFVAKYVRKQTGLREFASHPGILDPARLLDLGCGIGRHVVYGHRMGLEAYGVDLSHVAIETARTWAQEEGIDRVEERLVQGDVRRLPWQDDFFSYGVSHGVLDSMHFETAKEAMQELSRVMRPGGLFYLDLVSGDDSAHAREYAGEEVVESAHEKGTIQSYYNFTKLSALLEGCFEPTEINLVRKDNVLTGTRISRYHVIGRNLK